MILHAVSLSLSGCSRLCHEVDSRRGRHLRVVWAKRPERVSTIGSVLIDVIPIPTRVRIGAPTDLHRGVTDALASSPIVKQYITRDYGAWGPRGRGRTGGLALGVTSRNVPDEELSEVAG